MGGTNGFGAVSANNLGPYRDMWALRSARLGMDYDCFWDFGRMRARAWAPVLEGAGGSCKTYRITVHAAAPPVPVESAFNGVNRERCE